MKNALSLFRIFDIGFFLPGAVVLVALWYSWRISGAGQPPEFHPLSTSIGLIQALLALGTIYVLGLLIHAIQRVLFPLFFGSLEPQPKSKPWYCNLAEEQREDLVLYFWYLRATCWNLAVAIPVSCLLVVAGCVQKTWQYTFCALGTLSVPVSMYLLFFLGRDFWGAFEAGTQPSHPERPPVHRGVSPES
jgi:hypothetical protein